MLAYYAKVSPPEEDGGDEEEEEGTVALLWLCNHVVMAGGVVPRVSAVVIACDRGCRAGS